MNVILYNLSGLMKSFSVLIIVEEFSRAGNTVLNVTKTVPRPKKKFVLFALSVQYGRCTADPDSADYADQRDRGFGWLGGECRRLWAGGERSG
jgi:hypothetical protein